VVIHVEKTFPKTSGRTCMIYFTCKHTQNLVRKMITHLLYVSRLSS